MSAQEPTSDLSAIGRAAPREPVRIDPRTRECIETALGWAARSGGAFDPVATACAEADWQDLVLDEGNAIACRRLRVDLSGIAKGYAVDRAAGVLVDAGIDAAVVEAGGDLRVIGGDEEPIALRPSQPAPPAVIAIADGALASSDPALARAQSDDCAHRDGRTRAGIVEGFVAVAAPRCVDADALTKIVLALGDAAGPLLGDAVAYRLVEGRWSTLGAPA